jgi:hypothetical protein
VLRLITPQRTTTIPNLVQQGNPDGSQTDFTGLTFSGQTPQVPEKMWVARVTNFTVASSDKILKSLISAYNLKQSTNVDTMWIGLDYTLSYFEDSNTYNLGQNDLAPVDPPQTIAPSDVSQLVTVAQKMVADTFPSLEFVSFPNRIELLTGVGEFAPATPTTATYISVPFGPSFYGIPVVLEFGRTLPLTVYLDANGSLVKLLAQPYSSSFEATTQYYTLSVQEALREVESGNASIIESYSEVTGTPNLTQVVRGEFASVTVEYRIDTKTKLLVPYYHFVGNLVNYDNDLFTADVITPAVVLTP